MMRRFAVPAAVVLFLTVLGYGLTLDPRTNPSPLVGSPAPRFTLPLFDGGEITPADQEGRPLVVNFWASWCIPCRQEASLLQAAWEQFRERGILFIGVDIQDKWEDARAFIAEHHKTFPIAYDRTGKVSIDYGVFGVPETFFIDRSGIIRYKHIGPVTAMLLEKKVRELLEVEAP